MSEKSVARMGDNKKKIVKPVLAVRIVYSDFILIIRAGINFWAKFFGRGGGWPNLSVNFP